MFLRYSIMLYICGESLSLPIVIAVDFSRALSLLIVIALSLQVSVIASLRYCFEQHMQVSSFLRKYRRYFDDNAAQVLYRFLSHTAENKETTPFKSYILYCKLFKRALLFLRYRITLYPNVEMLSLHIVIALYHYRFGHMCNRYRFVPLSLQENW
jgi:hypothetical protein